MRRTPSLGNAEKWFQVFIVGIQSVGSLVVKVEQLSARLSFGTKLRSRDIFKMSST